MSFPPRPLCCLKTPLASGGEGLRAGILKLLTSTPRPNPAPAPSRGQGTSATQEQQQRTPWARVSVGEHWRPRPGPLPAGEAPPVPPSIGTASEEGWVEPPGSLLGQLGPPGLGEALCTLPSKRPAAEPGQHPSPGVLQGGDGTESFHAPRGQPGPRSQDATLAPHLRPSCT